MPDVQPSAEEAVPSQPLVPEAAADKTMREAPAVAYETPSTAAPAPAPAAHVAPSDAAPQPLAQAQPQTVTWVDDPVEAVPSPSPVPAAAPAPAPQVAPVEATPQPLAQAQPSAPAAEPSAAPAAPVQCPSPAPFAPKVAALQPQPQIPQDPIPMVSPTALPLSFPRRFILDSIRKWTGTVAVAGFYCLLHK